MKKDYMSRLSRAARWLLLPEDAAEVIADYKDIANGRSARSCCGISAIPCRQ